MIWILSSRFARVALIPLIALLLCSASIAVQPTSLRLVSSRPVCLSGKLECVDEVVREMTRRFNELAATCDHKAVFALLYLRTTEEYRRTVANNPTFFRDTPWVNHEAALFADYYFLAEDAREANFEAVPLAWQITIDAADRREVSGSGNLLLGVNAHINRDLPFVLAAKGLNFPDGSSRKPDHDKVNEILHRVAQSSVLREAASRFDPSITGSDVPGTQLDNEAFFQVIVTWRERAWHNAVRLAEARTSDERQTVANQIEQAAATEAIAIKQANAYRPPLSSSAARDAYCAGQSRR